MAVSFNDWKARGREHLAAGRALDALSCYRKAARLRPQARAPFTGIAESLWRLGKAREAIVAWREAAARKPEYLPTWQALAEAATFVADDVQALQAAKQVLAKSPDDRAARFIDACARMADPAQRDAACETLARLAEKSRHALRTPHMAAALARALSDAGMDSCRPLRQTLAARAASIPLCLVAQVARYVPARALRARIDAFAATDDVDDLRLIAQNAALPMGADATRLSHHADAMNSAPPPASRNNQPPASHDGSTVAGAIPPESREALAQYAAARYSALCLARYESDVPLMWPTRTAGDRVRMIVLVDTTVIDTQPDIWNALAVALQDVAARIDLAFAAFGDAQRIVDLLQSAPHLAARVTQMPQRPDIESARALAAGDPDLLVDLTFLARPTGELFVARPARVIASVASTPHPVVPLVDTLLPQDRSRWHAAIGALVADVVTSATAPSTADQMQARLTYAIEAHRNRRDEDALAAYDAVLREQSGHASTLHLRGVLRRDGGDDSGAAEDFAAALALAPRDVKSRVALAQLALAGHRTAEARKLLEDGFGDDPADISVLRALGHVALAQRDGASAINAFAAALALEPFDAETHFNHGVALQMMRYLGDAARSYQRSLELSPALLDAHFNMGIVFDELGETDSAITALEYVLKRQPARAEVHRTLLNVLSRAGHGREWMSAFAEFEKQCPSALGLVANALEYYQYMGDYARVHRYIDRLSRDEFKPSSELDLVDSLEQLLYLMLFFDVDPETQSSLYSTYDHAARRVYGEALAHPTERAPGRLRIGYLSADLRDHVMGRMMLDTIRHHDRERYAIHLYSTAEVEDEVTAAYRALGDSFESLAGASDVDAVRKIAEADLDILVDLSTHTRGARPAILARKPARVQITHVASAGALGLSAVDFKLTDRFADLPDSDRFLVETLLPMEGCAYPFRAMQPASDHPFHRAALGIADDAIIIGAFVTPLKLSRRTMALWKDILDRVPRARLAFSPTAAWLRDIYPGILSAANVDPARAIVLPQGRDEAENLARYSIVDFVLDPLPFGNVNGTIEPINMNVPVVTLRGQTHGERTGYSILTNLGETRTIASSGKEYVEIAQRLADDRAFMRDVRESMRTCLARSAWTDPRRYTRNLEAAYEQALSDAAQSGTDGVDR